MKLFGITGGIGMGKSTSRQFLEACGFSVIDTDDLARQLVEPGQPALEEIKIVFGDDVVTHDGRLNRAEFARKVFSDQSALRQLEAILHPKIRQLWQKEVAFWREAKKPFGFVVIPLLFETNAQSEFDSVIAVACSVATQRDRLRQRNWSDEQIDQRLSSQWPTEKKFSHSDYVIWTDTPLDVHEAQLARILT